MDYIWIFHGDGANFCSAVFMQRADAEFWINKNQFSGVLTKYPVNISVYDWAVQEQRFRPNKENPKTGSFVQNFTTASQEHFHYQNGVCA